VELLVIGWFCGSRVAQTSALRPRAYGRRAVFEFCGPLSMQPTAGGQIRDFGSEGMFTRSIRRPQRSSCSAARPHPVIPKRSPRRPTRNLLCEKNRRSRFLSRHGGIGMTGPVNLPVLPEERRRFAPLAVRPRHHGRARCGRPPGWRRSAWRRHPPRGARLPLAGAFDEKVQGRHPP